MVNVYNMPISVNDIESVYSSFRKAQANFNNRGYRLPKNFEKHFNEKMSEKNKQSLIKITGWFITKWINIDPYDYFSCGFELYEKNFSYAKFFKENIIKLYITRDKLKKRSVTITKQKLIESARFVKKWMKKHNASLDEYINTREGHNRLAVEHYLRNDIDASFFVYLIKKGMILNDNERSLIPYISKNYRKISLEFGVMEKFLKKLGDKL